MPTTNLSPQEKASLIDELAQAAIRHFAELCRLRAERMKAAGKE